MFYISKFGDRYDRESKVEGMAEITWRDDVVVGVVMTEISKVTK